MIFKQEMIDAILEGRKTVTRRPVNYGYTEGAVVPKRIALPCRYKALRSYSILPGRGQRAVARLWVRRVDREPLGGGLDWSISEAQREGFENWPDFREYWTRLYGSYDATQLIHRIEFELLPDQHQEGEGG